MVGSMTWNYIKVGYVRSVERDLLKDCGGLEEEQALQSAHQSDAPLALLTRFERLISQITSLSVSA